ncbi:MAG: isoleucine--tRNA ligase [Patescibacteria group bacterium]|nr:isoleucine--tRNA ligase [Patescibacteria group bacterium]
MFKPVSPSANFPEIEKEILEFWKKNKIFEKSLEKTKLKKKFNFYDGPPFATGLPHYGHILAMAIKDAITRYKTMQGFYVPRRLGWDCHGLPVEYEVEKELKISGKKQIEEMGVEKFCDYCRRIVFRYTNDWEKTIDRMGRFVDKEGTYATMELPYMESIWWVFKSLYEKGLIYKGFKSMPYCPRCATPLSNFETNQGYRDNVPDPSVFVKFELKGDPGTYFLVWTTTPWTLPANAALAVGPKVKYVKVETEDNEKLILSKERLSVLGKKYRIIKELSFKDLISKTYEPLFKFIDIEKNKKAHEVFAGDFVSTEEGTGIVHIAPAFGEDDLSLAQKENIAILQTVNERGEFIEKVKPWAGKFVKNADWEIIKNLKERNLLFKKETVRHTYPFCWRCDTPLIYYAITTWFVKVSEIRQDLVNNNEKIYWVPSHIKEGRFGKWLADARDWAISRNRYWGTPLPIWVCEECNNVIVVGSLDELNKIKTTEKPITDIHRPMIDEVKVKCKCGKVAKRIPEVLDCWFESGSMPYAQDHYPFENKQQFDKDFPADFIGEGLDQTRGWFYTLHVLSTILFDSPAFKNCIVNGIVLDKDGKKLSKRLRNYTEPETVFEKFGADSLRFLLLSSPAALADELRISDEAISQITRKVFLILWNVYNFFTSFANIDKWEKTKLDLESKNILDKWILSRLNTLIKGVTSGFDSYNLPKPASNILDFIVNDFSTWYIRRSRERVGPTAEDTEDKNYCYSVIFHVLTTIVKIIAPISPFLSDKIYKDLTGEESVHLSDWPVIDEKSIDKDLESQMDIVRKVVELGHSKRKEVGIKVRQPLGKFSIFSGKAGQFSIDEGLIGLIKDELNVKIISQTEGKEDLSVDFDLTIDQKLKEEGMAREIIRKIQEGRKKIGTKLDDFVDVTLDHWPKSFEDYIKKKTLVRNLSKGNEFSVKKV